MFNFRTASSVPRLQEGSFSQPQSTHADLDHVLPRMILNILPPTYPARDLRVIFITLSGEKKQAYRSAYLSLKLESFVACRILCNGPIMMMMFTSRASYLASKGSRPPRAHVKEAQTLGYPRSI